jgi:hypothetical protein
VKYSVGWLGQNFAGSGFTSLDVIVKGFDRDVPDTFAFKRSKFRAEPVYAIQVYTGDTGGFHDC